MKKSKKQKSIYTPGRPNTRKGVLRAVFHSYNRDKELVYAVNDLFANPVQKGTVASWIWNPAWSKAIALAAMLLVGTPLLAEAGTSCTSRKSGSVTITSCSNSGHQSRSTTCRSYMSGSVRKTSCS